MPETSDQQQQQPPVSDAVRRAAEIKERISDELLLDEQITGVGVGLRERDGEVTQEIVIRIYVRRKLPESHLQQGDILPKEIEGVGVDVVEAEFEAQPCHPDPRPPTRPPADRITGLNPLLAGCSIGNLTRGGSGTLGIRVYDAETGEDLILSNWHVLAQSLNAVPGEEIIQPGSGGNDPGGANDVIGELHRSALTDRVDAATARVTKERLLSEEVMGVEFRPHEWTPAMLGMQVFKSGRTTGVTWGVVTDINLDANICYYPLLGGHHRLRGQIGARLLSDRGDSGSGLFDSLGRVVGLQFAGGGGQAIANPIEPVLATLGIQLHQGIARAELIAAQQMLWV